MATQHSSEAWWVDQTLDVQGCNDRMLGGEWPAITIYAGSFAIAYVLGNGKGESAYNARLIAAAPELAAKLDAVQCYCPVHVQDEIRALIRKAKGGA